MTAKEILEGAEQLARESHSEATPWDARLLLAHAMGGRNPLSLDARQEVGERGQAAFRMLWARRVAGEPVQHLLGEGDFHGRPFFVDRRGACFRPRPPAPRAPRPPA